jgi:tetratricopeptide (TPR) repeat protein
MGNAGASSEVLPQQAKPDPRFDNLVRGDMFAGMAGDAAALARAMKFCEDTLVKNPKHPEALVWHGSGVYFLAGRAFQTGDFAGGMELFAKSIREMDEAVALLPESITVLIPRGAVLLEGSKHVPDPVQARMQLGKALGDYEKVLAQQKEDWAKLPLHSRGELLSGLAEGWYRAGDATKAKVYLQRIVAEMKGSAYADRAQAVLNSAEPPKLLNWRCLGCHVAP